MAALSPRPDDLFPLHEFRERLHDCFELRADALFELMKAILSAEAAPPSPVHLSLRLVHRRGRGSLYPALKKSA